MEETINMGPEQNELLVDEDEENSQSNKYLLFNLGDEVYGIAIAHVTEIIEMQKITDVPDMPRFIKGVINLRGRVIPIMDLRLRFGMPERAYDDRNCVIIVNLDGSSMGFIVDTVAEVHDITDGEIEPAPTFRDDRGTTRYISGLGKVDDRVTILINAHSLLTDKEMEAVRNAPKEAQVGSNVETE